MLCVRTGLPLWREDLPADLLEQIGRVVVEADEAERRRGLLERLKGKLGATRL